MTDHTARIPMPCLRKCSARRCTEAPIMMDSADRGTRAVFTDEIRWHRRPGSRDLCTLSQPALRDFRTDADNEFVERCGAKILMISMAHGHGAVLDFLGTEHQHVRHAVEAR